MVYIRVAKSPNLTRGGLIQGPKKKIDEIARGNFFFMHSRDDIHVKKHNGDCALLCPFSIQCFLCGLCVEMPCIESIWGMGTN